MVTGSARGCILLVGDGSELVNERVGDMRMPILDILGIIGQVLMTGIFLVLVVASIRGLWRMIRR